MYDTMITDDIQYRELVSNTHYIGGRGRWLLFKGTDRVSAFVPGTDLKVSYTLSEVVELFAMIDSEEHCRKIAYRLMEDPRDG